MLEFIVWLPLLALVAGGALLFYSSVIQMGRLDPGHNEPLGKRLRKWVREMADLIFRVG